MRLASAAFLPSLAALCLAACGGLADHPFVPLESQKFAASLGVDLAASTKTANGVYYRDLGPGSGAPRVTGDKLTVDYTGYLADGTIFDSSNSQGFTFDLGSPHIIAGWNEGLPGVQVGATRQLVIPSTLAYGASGQNNIPPNANLVFKISVKSALGPTPIESTQFASSLNVNLAASTKTANGVYYQDTTVGTGPAVVNGQTLNVDYVGYLSNGNQFDTSAVHFANGFSFKLGAGQVIPGWDQGLQGVTVGSVRKLVIPSQLAYGADGVPSSGIPPYANLVFDVTVHSAQ